ncbi:MAG: MYG1 family protein [Patescibacteria group bacterium]
MNSQDIKKIVTHSGNFHTDEVFACAVLSIFHSGAIEITRSRKPEAWTSADYVVDVGGVYDAEKGRFDHHQEGGAGARENGIPYSSLGLVWKHFGEQLCGSKEAALMIDEKLVQPVDAADNGKDMFTMNQGGVFPYLLHHVVASFRPTWKEDEMKQLTFDDGFARAMGIARQVLEREIVIARDVIEGRKHVDEIYHKSEDKRILVVPGQYPWEDVLNKYSEPIFVVKPDQVGKLWKVRTVRIHHESFASRKNFPKAWAGKTGEDFARISGVPDALFCHNSGTYIAVAGSKEGALKLAQIALEN